MTGEEHKEFVEIKNHPYQRQSVVNVQDMINKHYKPESQYSPKTNLKSEASHIPKNMEIKYKKDM